MAFDFGVFYFKYVFLFLLHFNLVKIVLNKINNANLIYKIIASV